MIRYIGEPCRLLLLLLGVVLSFAASLPRDHHIVYGLTGDSAILPCLHNGPFSSPADWVRPPTGQYPEKEICLGVVCQNGYALRFSVDANSNYQLTLRNARTNDSGQYVCIAYDEYTYYRYTVELAITDRPLKPFSAHTTATTSTVGYNSTTEDAQLRLSDVTLVVIVSAAVLTCSVLVAAAIVFVIIRRQKALKKTDSLSNFMQDVKKDPEIDFGDDNAYRKQKPQPTDELTTVEYVVLINDARLIALTFLKLFRESYNGSNKSATAAATFQLLASSFPLWWKALQGKSTVKRRIRCVLYYECSGYNVRPTRLNPIEPASATNPVMAVAVMHGRVYVISKESDTIHVDSDQKRSIRVKDMKYPVDIVSCASADKLYVSDEQRCIWRVIIGGETKKWKDFRERVPRTLSINCHGSLLVTTDSNVILKFTRDGSNGKVINLEEHTEVLHAVETSNHTAIICCRRGTRGCLVAEVGFDGQEIRKFICSAQLMRTPSYLALDRAGRLLVADPSNSRILLLDPKLKHGYTIINHQRHGIGAPQRLCLDELTGNLLVAEWPSHTIQAFNVKTQPTRSTSKLQKLFQLSV